MTHYFVTATGTDVGKTFVTAGLIRASKRKGRAVHALKPVASGFEAQTPEGSDPYVLMDALGLPAETRAADLERIAPWRFSTSVAGHGGGSQSREIDLADLEGVCREALATHETVFIEGVGGVMVPLNSRTTVLDWMAALRLPLILVTGSYLGMLSHTLTALDAVLRRELKVACIVVNESENATVMLEETATTIARFAHGTRVVTLPRNASPNAFDTLLGKLG